MPARTATVRVFYPDPRDLVLRTALDWGRDVEPARVTDTHAVFELPERSPYVEYKPCLRRGEELVWCAGTNKLALLAADAPTDVYPHFFSGHSGRITGPLAVPSRHLGRSLALRVYLPPGYRENQLKRYPVLYVHDGENLFFPDEAFLGREWQVDETLEQLDAMNVIDEVIVVAVHAQDRVHDYTEPGVEAYGHALIDELKPWIDRELRTLADARRTGVLGSSLGGVASLYLAWTWPQVFGLGACLSSTFGFRDGLLARVRTEGRAGREGLRLYLDSGWPHDNYEATLSMAAALIEAGFRLGLDLVHFAFPLARHDEPSWSARLHLPLQVFSGKLRRLADATASV